MHITMRGVPTSSSCFVRKQHDKMCSKKECMGVGGCKNKRKSRTARFAKSSTRGRSPDVLMSTLRPIIPSPRPKHVISLEEWDKKSLLNDEQQRSILILQRACEDKSLPIKVGLDRRLKLLPYSHCLILRSTMLNRFQDHPVLPSAVDSLQ